MSSFQSLPSSQGLAGAGTERLKHFPPWPLISLTNALRDHQASKVKAHKEPWGDFERQHHHLNKALESPFLWPSSSQLPSPTLHTPTEGPTLPTKANTGVRVSIFRGSAA